MKGGEKLNIFGSGINWGFSPQDLLTNSMSLYSSVAGIVMLVLALTFAPRLVAFIKGIFGGNEVEGSYEFEDSTWTYHSTDEHGRDWYTDGDGSWEKGHRLARWKEEGIENVFGDPNEE